MYNNIEDNSGKLVDFGYGFAKFDDMEENRKQRMPIGKSSALINDKASSVWFLPPAIAPDEVFVDLSSKCLMNTFARYIVSNYGRIYDKYSNKFVPARFNKPFDKNGYNSGRLAFHAQYYIDPYTISSKDLYVHRAVLMSFNYIEGCENLEVNHKNGVTADNRLCNLEWTTSEENINHSITNCLNSSPNYKRAITDEEAETICKRLSMGEFPADISRDMHIANSVIMQMIGGVVFQHITSKYKIPGSIYNFPNVFSIGTEAIHSICKMIEDCYTISDISNYTGINRYIIASIKNRELYTDISINYNFTNSLLLKDNTNRGLNDAQVHEVCRRLQLGQMPSEIASFLNISPNIIDNIKSGTSYSEISRFYKFPKLVSDTLDENLVHNICKDMENGMHNVEIARKYNIPTITVGHIRRGETYKYISSNYNIPRDIGMPRELSDETVHEICRKLAEGLTPTDVANIVGVEVSKVNGIKSGVGYNDISSQYTFPCLVKKYSKEDLHNICKDIASGMRNIDVANKYKCSTTLIKGIKNGSKYNDIYSIYHRS